MTTGRFRDNLKAPGYSVDRAKVVAKCLIAKARDELGCDVVLYVAQRRDCASEGIDRVSGGRRLHIGLQAVAVHHVDVAIEHCGDIAL